MRTITCTLEQAVDSSAFCPGRKCSFWVEDDDPHCLLTGIEREVLARPALAGYLIGIRDDLDRRAHEARYEQTVRPQPPDGTRSGFVGRR